MNQEIQQEKRWKGYERKPQHGDVIGEKYTVIGRALGKGRTGAVYRVRGEDGSVWALKAIESEISNRSVGLRRGPSLSVLWDAVARSSHPNLVGWGEVFTVERSVFLCMEEVEGISLKAWLREEKRLPSGVAAGIGAAIASALEHLHAYRLTHRYLRPEDILLGRDGSIRVSMSALHLFEGLPAGRDADDQGGIRYGSPEQLQMPPPVMIGPESDIYSLGLLLGEMVTGGDLHGVSRWASVEEICKQRKRSDTFQSEQLPEGWSVWLRKLVAYDVTERLSDVAWVGQQVQAFALPSHELRRVIQDAVERWGSGSSPVIRSSARKVATPPPAAQARVPSRAIFSQPPPSSKALGGLMVGFLLITGLFGAVGFVGWQKAENERRAERVKQEEEKKREETVAEVTVSSVKELLQYATPTKSSVQTLPAAPPRITAPALVRVAPTGSSGRLASLQASDPAEKPLVAAKKRGPSVRSKAAQRRAGRASLRKLRKDRKRPAKAKRS